MNIYIDSDYKCHVENNGTLKAINTNFFDRKCTQYIEGYRFVPHGDKWINENGIVFQGEMIAPWKNFDELDSAQRTYEQELIKEQEALIAELDTALLETTYNNLILAKMGE